MSQNDKKSDIKSHKYEFSRNDQLLRGKNQNY